MEPWMRPAVDALVAEHGIVPPPWVVYFEHPSRLCWRMGGGEGHLLLWWAWWEEQAFTEAQKVAYFHRWPPLLSLAFDAGCSCSGCLLRDNPLPKVGSVRRSSFAEGSMRTCAFVCLAVGMVLAGEASTLPRAGAEEKPTPLSLSYAYAGLTEITVTDGKLRYVWHTPRLRDDEAGPLQSSPTEYDRHQIDVRLTDKELGKFRDWVARHKVFEFATDYPSASGGRSRGAAYQSGLSVVQGDKKQAVTWVGDSKTPKELDTAMSELTSLADAIEKSRRK